MEFLIITLSKFELSTELGTSTSAVEFTNSFSIYLIEDVLLSLQLHTPIIKLLVKINDIKLTYNIWLFFN